MLGPGYAHIRVGVLGPEMGVLIDHAHILSYVVMPIYGHIWLCLYKAMVEKLGTMLARNKKNTGYK